MVPYLDKVWLKKIQYTKYIYFEVLDQIWSVYICETYINVSLSQPTIINLSIYNIITDGHAV